MHRRALLVGFSAALVSPAHGAALRFEEAARYSAARRGVSFAVMREGRILFEDYPGEGGADRAWELASGTKSFTGIIAAAAAADGFLDIDELCAETLPEWRGDARRRIAIRHLLTLTSGIVDTRIGIAPTYEAAIATQVSAAPGARFAYGPSPFQIFGEIMRRKLAARGRPTRNAAAYLHERVLDQLRAPATRWRNGRDGQPLMPQGAQFTARNWAAFGQYVLDGARGLDPATMRACFEATRANPGYGLSWWLLRPGLIPPAPGAGVDGSIGPELAREDIVMAAGAGDQRLYLLRRRNLVVVRQANRILRARAPGQLPWRDAEFLQTLLA
jgi:CubicO group peptidase (beta-lactamase class C family)